MKYLIMAAIISAALAFILLLIDEMCNGVYYYRKEWKNYVLKLGPKLLCILAVVLAVVWLILGIWEAMS